MSSDFRPPAFAQESEKPVRLFLAVCVGGEKVIWNAINLLTTSQQRGLLPEDWKIVIPITIALACLHLHTCYLFFSKLVESKISAVCTVLRCIRHTKVTCCHGTIKFNVL